MICFFLSSLVWAGSVDIFQAQPIVADGESQYTIQLRVPEITAEDEVRIQGLSAIIDEQFVESDGLITLKLRARAIQPKETLSLKVVSKEKGIEEVVELALASTDVSKMVIRFDPPRLMPEQRTAVVKVQIDDLAMHQPVLQASAGSLSELNVAGDGLWTALYTVPDNLSQPQAVLFSAIDLSSPETMVAAATLPIAREASVEVDGLKGTVLRPELRGESLADVAIVNGKATITADLFPDDTFAKGTLIRNGKKPKPVRLNFDNPAQPVTDIVLPEALSNVPKGQELSYWVVASDAKGALIRKAEKAFIEVDGKSSLTSVKPGFFKGDVEIPSVGDSLALRVSVDGVDSQAELTLVPNLPQLTAQFSPDDISQTTKIEWSLLAKDGSGAMLNDLQLQTQTNIGRWRSDLKSDGEGGYRAELSIPKNTDSIFAYASPINLKSQLPPARVHLVPSVSSMPVNHAKGVPVFAVVEDALGMPKSGVQVNLKVPIGDGVVPAQVTTDDSGIAMFMYRAGPSPGPILISAQSGQLSNAIRMDQVEEGRMVQRDVVLGTEANRKARERWRAAIPSIYVDPEIDVQAQQAALVLIEQGKTAITQQVVPEAPEAVATATGPEAFDLSFEEELEAKVTPQAPEPEPEPQVVPSEPEPVIAQTEEKAEPPKVEKAVEPEKPEKPPREKATREPSIGPMSGYRLRGYGGYGFYQYQQLIEGESDTYPTDIPFSSGVLGGGARFDALVMNNKIALSALASAFPYRATVGTEQSNEALVNMNGGLSYRHSLSDKWALEGGLGYQTGRGILFKYGDTQDSADITRLGIGGLTLNAAATAKIGTADLQIRLSEMFILTPAQTSAHLLLDYPIQELSMGNLILSADAGIERRYFTVETGGEAIQITDSNVQMLIGLGIHF